MTGDGPKGLIAGLGSVESSFLMQTALCLLERTDPDYANLLVLNNYLTQVEVSVSAFCNFIICCLLKIYFIEYQCLHNVVFILSL